jgi:hypothetical protein
LEKYMNRYAFVHRAPNNAKYGACAPRDGYVSCWKTEDPAGYSDEEIENLEARERAEAFRQKAEWLGE